MSDLALTTTTLALEASQHRLGWGHPARLFGITPAFTWVQVDEGDPYDIVGLFTLLPGEDFVAVALVVEGWAAPPDGPRPRPPSPPASGCGRRWPSTAPAPASPSSGQRDGEPEVMPPGGTGALMEQLLQVWQRATAVES